MSKRSNPDKHKNPDSQAKRPKKENDPRETDAAPMPSAKSPSKAPPTGRANKRGVTQKKLVRSLTIALFCETLYRTGTYPHSEPRHRRGKHAEYWKKLEFLGVPFHMYLGKRAMTHIRNAARRGVDDLFLHGKVSFVLSMYDMHKKETGSFTMYMEWDEDNCDIMRTGAVFRNLLRAVKTGWKEYPDASNRFRSIKIAIDDFDYDFESGGSDDEPSGSFKTDVIASRQSLGMADRGAAASVSASASETYDLPVLTTAGLTVRGRIKFDH